jgi:hypothetical protein
MISGLQRWRAPVTIVLALACVGGCGLVEDWAMDNRSSGVPCDRLPERAVVVDALNRHTDLVSRLVAVAPDEVHVDVSGPCDDRPSAAEILITYASHGQRTRIEDLLRAGGFGVPTSLRNV